MAAKERKSMQGGVRIHSVKYNVIMNMILTSSSFLFPLITTPYVSRVLSTTGTGAVSFVQNVAHYFSLVAMLGVRYYGTRACAQVRDDPKELAKTVREILSLLMVSTAIVTVVYFGALFVVPKFGEERELFLIFALYIWLTSLGVEWFYQALEQYDYITARSIIFKLISLVLMFVFVRDHDDYIIYGGIVIFASVASNILNIIRLNRLVDLHSPQEMDIWHHLKPMKWFAIALISSGMYVSVDIVLLGFLGTTHMVGLYQLVSKIKSVLVSCVNAVGNVMLPRLAHYQSSGNDKASNALISKSFNFVSIIGAAIISLLAICAMPTVLIMGGTDFVDSATPLACVGPAVLFSALNIVLANYLIAHDREKNWAAVNVLGLIFAVIANFLLIPLFGVVGSAIAISLCEFLMFLMRSFVCHDLIKSISPLIDPIKIAICALVSAAGSWAIIQAVSPSSSFVFVLIAGFSYAAIYLVVLLVTKEMLAQELIGSVLSKVGHGS